ncbi:MAG: ParB/RepB/Spo0J family partition protein [Rhabdochlamydiaceae bacterium]
MPSRKTSRRFGSEMLPGFLDELWVKTICHSKSPLREDLGFIDGLIVSIKEKGVLQPILVRPVGDKFEAVSGNRRLEACKRLGLKKVPCYVIGLDDKQAYEVSLIENLQRSSLNAIEEAKAFSAYVDEHDYGGLSELARRIGKSEPHVSRRIALLDLPSKIQEQIISRRIAPSVGEELVYLNQIEVGEIAKQFISGRITRTRVRSTIRELRASKTDSSSDEFSTVQVVQESLQRTNRTSSKCEASLKSCLIRMDDAIDSPGENEWFIRDNLSELRRTTRQSIDGAIILRMRINSQPDLLVPSQSPESGHQVPRMHQGLVQV